MKTKRFLNKKNKTFKLKKGGDITKHLIFKEIKSIGFEIETTDLIKLTITPNENTTVLVNSSLTNIDLEYGFTDLTEYTDIKNNPNETFKITNDSAEDSDFNILIEKTYGSYKIQNDENLINEDDNDDDNEDDDEYPNPIIKITFPKNKYLNQTNYDLKFREVDGELTNFSSFTDTEFISTYYNPIQSDNIIENYFFISMKELITHLKNLKTINNSRLFIKPKDKPKYIMLDGLSNQAFVLPNTSLVYYNSSLYKIQKYNIQNDLKIVVQMTFSCDVSYVYKLMVQLMDLNNNLLNSSNNNDIVNFINMNKNNPNVNEITNTLNNYAENINYDLYAIYHTFNIVNKLFKQYEKINPDKKYSFNSTENKKLKMYIFLLLYKLLIYLNSYIELGNMLKKHLSFAVRHNNYVLFLEIKNQIKTIFASEFNGKDENYVTNEINKIILKLFNENELNKLYDTSYIKNQKIKLNLLINKNDKLKEKYDGNPLYSIISYINYFDTNNSDWLVDNDIDEKSTKFDLVNDTIIIEFRDYPLYSYMNIFFNSNDVIRTELIKNNVGTLNMGIVKQYMALKKIR